MATYQQNMETARNQIAERLVEITANPKPSYSIDGESYSWTEYFNALNQQLAAINAQVQQSGGPFEIRTRGVT